jgi:hypothetical protein
MRIQERKFRADKFADEFKRATGWSLGRFFNVVYGFDVVALEDALEIPDGTSCKDICDEQFGEDFTNKLMMLF